MLWLSCAPNDGRKCTRGGSGQNLFPKCTYSFRDRSCSRPRFKESTAMRVGVPLSSYLQVKLALPLWQTGCVNWSKRNRIIGYPSASNRWNNRSWRGTLANNSSIFGHRFDFPFTCFDRQTCVPVVPGTNHWRHNCSNTSNLSMRRWPAQIEKFRAYLVI